MGSTPLLSRKSFRTFQIYFRYSSVRFFVFLDFYLTFWLLFDFYLTFIWLFGLSKTNVVFVHPFVRECPLLQALASLAQATTSGRKFAPRFAHLFWKSRLQCNVSQISISQSHMVLRISGIYSAFFLHQVDETVSVGEAFIFVSSSISLSRHHFANLCAFTKFLSSCFASFNLE